MCALLASSMIFSACQKEDENILILRAPQFANNGKTYLSDDVNGYLCWENGDQVLVNGTELDVSVSETSASSYEATINIEGVAPIDDAYWLAFPSERCAMSGASITVRFPAVEAYQVVASGPGSGRQMLISPIVGKSRNGGVDCANVASLVQVALRHQGAAGSKLVKLAVIADNANLSGEWDVAESGGGWALTPHAGSAASNSRTLDFGDGITLGTDYHYFYLAVPPANDMQTFTLRLTLLDAEGSTVILQRTSAGSSSIAMNTCYDLGTLTFDGSSISNFSAVTPDGSESNPYLISSAAQWASVMGSHATQNKYFLLTHDISLTGTTISSFAGILDAQGHSITLSQPLFETVSGTIENLVTKGAIEVSDALRIGAVTNQLAQGTLRNCRNEASISAVDCSNVGGLVGNCSRATVEGCVNVGSVTLQNSLSINNYYVGGIFGTGGNSTIACVNQGAVYFSGDCDKLYIGGIGGSCGGTTKNCANYGNVTENASSGTRYLGGVAGSLMGTLLNCLNEGTLTAANSSVGGIAGYASSFDMKNSYSKCAIVAAAGGKAGIVCLVQSNGNAMNNCYCWSSGHSLKNSGTVTITHCFDPSSTDPHLTSATELSDGTSLVNVLNAGRADITDAAEWEVRDGRCTFVQ